MTKQDNDEFARIGLISFDKRGHMIFANRTKIPLSESLLDFLNVNSVNIREVTEYCQRVGYIPEDISESWIDGFRNEQLEIKEITQRYMKNAVTNEDLQIIASKLATMSIKYRLLTIEQLESLNKDLLLLPEKNSTDYPVLDTQGKTNYFIEVKEYSKFHHVIWDGLLNLIRIKRPLRKCKNVLKCTRFFIPNKYKPNQQFCTPNCEDVYRKSH